MSDQLPVPAASNTFERIKRLDPEGHESWSARNLAHALEYLNFRNFQPVIEKAQEACAKNGHAVADHFAEKRNMVGIGSGAQREVEDWVLSRCRAGGPRHRGSGGMRIAGRSGLRDDKCHERGRIAHPD